MLHIVYVNLYKEHISKKYFLGLKVFLWVFRKIEFNISPYREIKISFFIFTSITLINFILFGVLFDISQSVLDMLFITKLVWKQLIISKIHTDESQNNLSFSFLLCRGYLQSQLTAYKLSGTYEVPQKTWRSN